jgi:hypothetical protein
VAHSRTVLSIALQHGWRAGARYTNLRDVRHLTNLGFLDIDWQHYSFARHLEAARTFKPLMTVARDVTDLKQLDTILEEATLLAKHSRYVVVVPKDSKLHKTLGKVIPPEFVLGYSVPTRYGGTPIAPQAFKSRVHLLGGRPDVQRRLAEVMNVVSVDCNRFTLDAAFGDYFDGETFRPHPEGGYQRCLKDSILNINRLWETYNGREELRCEWSRRSIRQRQGRNTQQK